METIRTMGFSRCSHLGADVQPQLTKYESMIKRMVFDCVQTKSKNQVYIKIKGEYLEAYALDRRGVILLGESIDFIEQKLESLRAIGTNEWDQFESKIWLLTANYYKHEQQLARRGKLVPWREYRNSSSDIDDEFQPTYKMVAPDQEEPTTIRPTPRTLPPPPKAAKQIRERTPIDLDEWEMF